MTLSEVELRVLGALVEKERTTPETYPLSTQALVTACNQRTSREPVTDHHLQDVRDAVNRLRDRGLAATVQEVGDRVPKHRHLLKRAWTLDETELALLAVLMLRGEQTAAELRTRSERYGGIPDLAGVEAALAAMARRDPAMVRNVGRAPGQAQDRWAHTLGGDEARLQPRVRAAPRAHEAGGRAGDGGVASAAAADAGDLAARLAALEVRVAELEARLAAAD
ncbi:MAG: YceH family protein [Trueperaceae bacterium]|nr:YceH family protein [Trueperaceae bacterium]